MRLLPIRSLARPVACLNSFCIVFPCLPARCWCWWCGGFLACGSCVLHACYMPELRTAVVLHDIGLVLVHGVLRVAPSAAPHEPLLTTPHWGAGVGCDARARRRAPCLYPAPFASCIPSQMLKTQLTCVMHCSRSLIGHLVAPNTQRTLCSTPSTLCSTLSTLCSTPSPLS